MQLLPPILFVFSYDKTPDDQRADLKAPGFIVNELDQKCRKTFGKVRLNLKNGPPFVQVHTLSV